MIIYIKLPCSVLALAKQNLLVNTSAMVGVANVDKGTFMYLECTRILLCGHSCSGNCAKNCPPCNKARSYVCPHGKCGNICHSLCRPCTHRCKWMCLHQRCTKRCGEIYNRKRCDKPCKKRLKCGHPCLGLCNEQCPPVCHTECDTIKDKVARSNSWR